jgi:hypothetical protein
VRSDVCARRLHIGHRLQPQGDTCNVMAWLVSQALYGAERWLACPTDIMMHCFTADAAKGHGHLSEGRRRLDRNLLAAAATARTWRRLANVSCVSLQCYIPMPSFSL